MGIVFDKKLKFETHIEETREKMLKANNLLQHMNGVGKKMEINTTEILYKVLVRSMFDYGSMIYFPKTEMKRTRLEKAQYQG